MKNIKISTRILGIFGILVVLLIAVVSIALMQLRSMRGNTETITGNALPSVETINTISTELVRARLLELRHVNSSDAEQMAQVEKQYAELQVRLAADKTPLQEFIDSFGHEDQESQERRCAAISEELAGLQEQEENLVKKVADLRNKVEALSRTDELSQLLQQEAALVEDMERMAFAWSRISLARSILETAKRTFEQERQRSYALLQAYLRALRASAGAASMPRLKMPALPSCPRRASPCSLKTSAGARVNRPPWPCASPTSKTTPCMPRPCP